VNIAGDLASPVAIDRKEIGSRNNRGWEFRNEASQTSLS
jgi:hypothetical protein